MILGRQVLSEDVEPAQVDVTPLEVRERARELADDTRGRDPAVGLAVAHAELSNAEVPNG